MSVCVCLAYAPVWEGLLLCASACLPCDPVVHVYPSSIPPSLHPSSVRPFTIHPSSIIQHPSSTTCPLTHGFDNSTEMSVPAGWPCHPELKGSPLRDHPHLGLESWTPHAALLDPPRPASLVHSWTPLHLRLGLCMDGDEVLSPGSRRAGPSFPVVEGTGSQRHRGGAAPPASAQVQEMHG